MKTTMSATPFDALMRSAREYDGVPPFSDGALVDYARGTRQLVMITDAAAALVAGTEAEFVVAPRSRRQGLGTAMVERLQRDAPGSLTVWSHGDLPAAQVLAQRHGFERVRELLHLRAAVGPDPADRAGLADRESGVTHGGGGVSAFDPERDTDELLALNAAAFANHPEQGALTRADLETTMRQPWFRNENLLLLRDGRGALVAFCWLKVEGTVDDRPDGEFYVVGVSPEHQGEGLGRRAVDAGMTRLRELGIRSTHLYVEGDNTAALRLYHSFGFAEASIDVQYRWERGTRPER